jgi:zinc protease
VKKAAAAIVLFIALLALGATTAPKITFTDTTLPNGLRVIISQDTYAPLYAICISYKVGSRNEAKGRTGFAHLFEHMMFKGSENVGVGELDYLIYTNGDL